MMSCRLGRVVPSTRTRSASSFSLTATSKAWLTSCQRRNKIASAGRSKNASRWLAHRLWEVTGRGGGVLGPPSAAHGAAPHRRAPGRGRGRRKGAPKLLGASSPYARRGALWDAFRKHFAKDNDPVLVWK